MRILAVIFEGYNKFENQFADCVILIKENLFTIKNIYEISEKNKFPICPEIEIKIVAQHHCNDVFENAYEVALKKDFSFTPLIDSMRSGKIAFKTPRFSELDFENLIKGLGGRKIPEINIKTPDFLLNDIVLELKDIQKEGLLNNDRRTSIAKIFNAFNSKIINIDSAIDYGEYTTKYHALIANTIQNHFKKASEQIKIFKENNKIKTAGIILLNTGMFSLNHDLFKFMIENILLNKTQTIKFALILSQISQSNWFDSYSNFYSDILGDAPKEIETLKDKLNNLIDDKMTQMVINNKFDLSIDSLHPITFQADGKIFYWNPGRPHSSVIE